MLLTDPDTQVPPSDVIEYDGPDVSLDELMTQEERLHYEYDLLNEVLIDCYEFLRYAYETTPLMAADELYTAADILGPRVPISVRDFKMYLFNYWV